MADGGGGLLTAAPVYLKFFIAALHLNKFVEGVLFSLDYVGSFLAIHFAHFTLATKQPAMTAQHWRRSSMMSPGRRAERRSLTRRLH